VEVEKRHFLPVFRRQPLVLDRGEGCRVWDVDGRAYLDLAAGIAVASLGHAHPVISAAIERQASLLLHSGPMFLNRPQLELAELLVEHSPFDRVFFCNSGSEANEAAIKLARKWGKLHRGGAYGVISAVGAFHGRTLAAVTATGKEAYTRPFTPLPSGFTQVPFNDVDTLERAWMKRRRRCCSNQCRAKAASTRPRRSTCATSRNCVARSGCS
jgi:acetylornithine aminotransferase/acetylornithine/N-succinyldiaminopimelate aminotransferase